MTTLKILSLELRNRDPIGLEFIQGFPKISEVFVISLDDQIAVATKLRCAV